MKIISSFIFLFCSTILSSELSWIKNLGIKLYKDKNFVSTQYVVVVTTTTQTSFAKLYAYEIRQNKKIVPVLEEVDAVIGKNGFAEINTKLEGDGKTPTGVYGLGPVFYQTRDVKTKLDKIKIQDDDYWIDDVNSEFYNMWIRGSLPQGVKSYEKMKIPLYKYCIVIQYNMNPVIKGKGSAIFFHLWKDRNSPTAGCVAVDEKTILKLLRWLDKKKNPVILLGTKEILESLATQ